MTRVFRPQDDMTPAENAENAAFLIWLDKREFLFITTDAWGQAIITISNYKMIPVNIRRHWPAKV